MVKNYMELVVENILPSVLKSYDNLCQCETCINDIKAMTLNQLKPLYYVNEKGNMYSKLNELMLQFNTDVTKAIVHSIETVKENPRHN